VLTQVIPLVQTVGIFLAGASLTLNYFSHRESVTDSPFERESKIDGKIEKIPIAVGGLSEQNYKIAIDFIKSTIDEKPMHWHSYRFLSPFGEIEGQTQLSFSIREIDSELQPSKYVSDLSSMDTQIAMIGLNIESETGGMFSTSQSRLVRTSAC